MRGTRVPAIVPSDFRLGTEVVGRRAVVCSYEHNDKESRGGAGAD